MGKRKEEMSSNEEKYFRKCTIMYIYLNMRGMAAECVKKAMALIDSNTKSVTSH